MKEADIMRLIQVSASNVGYTLLRNNTGEAYVGKVLHIDQKTVVLENYRILHAGLCKGSSDLIGWTDSGLFCAIEVKTPRGKVRKEQQAFLSAVTNAGGLAAICRSPVDFLELARGQRKIQNT